MSKRQSFTTLDYLRMEVAQEPVGLVNLVENPNGELGSAGYITPTANTIVDVGAMSGQPVLRFLTGVEQIAHWTTTDLPIIGGRWASVALRFRGGTAGHNVSAVFDWYNAAGQVTSSSGSVFWPVGSGAASYGPEQAPAGTVRARVRFRLHRQSTITAASAGAYVFFDQVTVATSASQSQLGLKRTNYVVNPSFETNTTSWTPTACTLARSSAATWGSSWALQVTCTDSIQALVRGSGPGSAIVAANQVWTVSAYVYSNGGNRPATIGVSYPSGQTTTGGVIPANVSAQVPLSNGWNRLVHTFTVPANAVNPGMSVAISILGVTGQVVYVDAVMLEQRNAVGDYFDGSTPDGNSTFYDWTSTAHGSFSVMSQSLLGYVAPIVYQGILGGSHSLKITRSELQPGTLSANVLDVALDPAKSNLIRPGRRCRVLAKAGDTWEPIFLGRITQADVKYDLRNRDQAKRARISLTAVDNVAQLANTPSAQGVANVVELPHVLESAGVPYNVNGSGVQVGAVTIASVNANASALDQLAVTRDTQSAYAWVDRKNVVQAWDRSTIGTKYPDLITADEHSYTDLDTSFSTRNTINAVMVKSIELDPENPGAYREVPYGPFVDQASVQTWGMYSTEITVHGLTPAQIAARANAILAANGTPTVRVNSLRMPVWTPENIAVRALVDLYQPFKVVHADSGLNATLRIAGVEQTITTRSWDVDLTFAESGAVATPTATAQLATADPAGNLVLAPGAGANMGGSSYYFVKNGAVQIRVWSAPAINTTQADTAFVMPAGLRPPYDVYFAVADGNTGAPRMMCIDTNGRAYHVVSLAAGQFVLGHVPYVPAG